MIKPFKRGVKNLKFYFKDLTDPGGVNKNDEVQFDCEIQPDGTLVIVRVRVVKKAPTEDIGRARSASATPQRRYSAQPLMSAGPNTAYQAQRQGHEAPQPLMGNNSIDSAVSNNRPKPNGKLFQKQNRTSKQKGRQYLPPRTALQSVQGKVVHFDLERNSGIIQPLGNLPNDYPPDQRVFFTADIVKSGGLLLKVGDVLEFCLGTKDKTRPRAIRARLGRAVRRSNVEIVTLINDMQEKLTNKSDFRSHGQSESDEENSLGTEEDRMSFRRDFLLEILDCKSLWEAVGNCEGVSSKTTMIVIEFLLMVGKKATGMKERVKSILQAFSSTAMFHPWTGSIRRLIQEKMKASNKSDLIMIRTFFFLMLQNVPEKIHAILALIKIMVSKDGDSLDNFLFVAMKEMAKLNSDSLEGMEWNDLPLVPSVGELTERSQEYLANLSPVLTTGSYQSAHEYFDVYFRLLRADCFGALCKHLQELLDGKLNHKDMNVYRSVRLVGISVNHSDSGIAVMLQVTSVIPVTNWSTSPKLMFGNLLCISPSGTFNDPIWATVTNRDADMLQKNQCIMVELCTNENHYSNAEAIILLSQAGRNMIMAESPAYYHSFKPVLRTLQRTDPDKIPFVDELIHGKFQEKRHGKFQEKRPQYINNMMENIMHLCSNDEEELSETVFWNIISTTWPKTLDKYQKESMKKIFLQRIGCIQGPPGTGKTFIGICIVRAILELEYRPEGPILVLTYKNHALDEFLKELLNYYPEEIVRVGGRSTETDLQSRNLNEIKRAVQKSKSLRQSLAQIYDEIRETQPWITQAANRLDHALTLRTDTVLETFTKDQILHLLLGCDRKHFKGHENIIQSFADGKGPVVAFFHNGSANRRLLDFAIKSWMPDEASIEETIKKLKSMQAFLEKLSQTEQHGPGESEPLFDEKDIEDMEKERKNAANYKPVKSETFIKLGNTNMTGFLQFLSLDGYNDQLVQSSLMHCTDLWTMNTEERIKVVQHLLLQQIEEPAEDLESVLLHYERLCVQKKELNEQHKIAVLQSMKVVGMTITGACIHSDILAELRPAIVIVEEAAEVLEPLILATLGEWVQHLILIGDHKQLRPPVENYELVKNFNFDVSMMERLINNKIPHGTLNLQNRMRQEFADLLLDIYPKLETNTSRVKDNHAAKCIEKSMYFWNHADPETGGRSYSNEKEAERAVKLALFLLQQGYLPEQVTLLAAYQGQVTLLRQKIKTAEQKHPELFPTVDDDTVDNASVEKNKTRTRMKIHTIDMYQGDENDIVIVSLVRSNKKKAIGFLKFLNRRCVAQSRSKCGLYFIGDSDTMSETQHWKKLIGKMNTQGCCGNQIPLCCPQHPSSKISATTGDDINLGSFCKVVCNSIMHCGKHICQKTCQPPHSDSHLRCEIKMKIVLTECGHQNQKMCFEDERSVKCKILCGKVMDCKFHMCPKKCFPEHTHHYCTEKVKFSCKLCGNENEKMCSESEEKVRCESKVIFTHTLCGHVGEKSCYESCSAVKCKDNCLRILPCGHPCTLKCGDACNPAACKICKQKKKMEMEKLKKIQEEKKKEAINKINEELEFLVLQNSQESSSDQICQILEIFPEGNNHIEYLKVEDMVTKYILPEHNWVVKVKQIFIVQNANLRMAYLQCRAKLSDPNVEELKFHGTSDDAIENIIQEGFKLPSNPGMFGCGIYFATDSSKSGQARYTRGSNKLLLCEVALGKYRTLEKHCRDMDLKKLQSYGSYDSVFAPRGTKDKGGVLNDEFIVYQPTQAFPKYIIYYDHCVQV